MITVENISAILVPLSSRSANTNNKDHSIMELMEQPVVGGMDGGRDGRREVEMSSWQT